MILPAKVQARMILEVMPQARRDGGQPGCIIVRVRNIIPHHDGTWLVGCGLVKPRTEEELDALLNVCSDGRA